MDRNLIQHTKVRIFKGGSAVDICVNCHMTMHAGQTMHNQYDCEKALQEASNNMQARVAEEKKGQPI